MSKIYKQERIWDNYYLDQYECGLCDIGVNPCDKCDLCDICDEMADTLNNIEYCICLSKPEMKAYKETYKDAYFKMIKED